MTSDPIERMSRARAAQQLWRQTPLRTRCLRLRELRARIAARRDEIVEVICRETGKPRLDALTGDVMVTLEQMRYYEIHAPRLLRRRSIGKPPLLYSGNQFYEEHEPYGVALIYAPANYPFQLSVVPMITALFAGNAVILKCSERTPEVARMIESLCREAGFLDDLVQVIIDAPQSAASYIDAGPDLIFFTGSSENGRAVAVKAAQMLIPAVLELGGKDAAIVFADCNLDRAINGIIYGAFSHAGQVCVGIKRLFVEESIRSAFLERFVQRIGDLRIGTSADADLGILPGDDAKARLRSQVEDAIQRGAVVEYPRGGPITGETPVVLRDVPATARVIVEESFGPILCAASFRGEAEAITLANASCFALSASVWTGDLKRAERVAAAMSSGTCGINDVIRNIANPHAAFGGNRHSGYGRYHGPLGLYAFSRIKSVMASNGKRKHEINWFPFTERTFHLLDALMGWRHGSREFLSGIRRLFLAALMFAGFALPFAG